MMKITRTVITNRQSDVGTNRQRELSTSGCYDRLRGQSNKSTARTKLSKVNEKGETNLHRAAIAGDGLLVGTLINQGADVNARDYCGWQPLHEACNHGHTDRYTTGNTLFAKVTSVILPVYVHRTTYVNYLTLPSPQLPLDNSALNLTAGE
ncbi:hypothetical protein QZH41_000754 [Actinostola sp. cb2023]|nr:hypothetical protein QZH41_000754 [Actinostola sp. cb2023]